MINYIVITFIAFHHVEEDAGQNESGAANTILVRTITRWKNQSDAWLFYPGMAMPMLKQVIHLNSCIRTLQTKIRQSKKTALFI